MTRKFAISDVAIAYFNVLWKSPLNRVATDLHGKPGKSGNLKETPPESQGVCDRIPKVREIYCLKFIFSQVEDPNFENFLREHAPRLP